MKVEELLKKLNELVEQDKGDYEIEVEMHELYSIEVDDRCKVVELEN